MKYTLFSLGILGILFYPFNMSTEVWGQLPKSQDDNTTIDQAIAAAIADHEADPEAHTGENESLAAHRENEILDHPQQSVVMDKQVFSFYDEMTQPLGGYGWDPDVGSISGAGTRNVYFSLFSQTEVFTQMALPFEEGLPYPNADLILRFYLLLNGAQNSNGSSSLSFFNWAGADVDGRIDFVKDGTTYKVKFYYDDVLVHSYTLQTGGQFESFIALYYNKNEQRIDLFLNGELADSYTPSVWYDFIPYVVSASGSRTTNTSIELNVTRWGAKYTLF